MRQFMADGKVAPRLPDVSEKTFTQIVSEIKETLIQLYENCMSVEECPYICGNINIDRLLVFDNNNSPTLIFDSKNNENKEFKGLISHSFGFDGTRKKRYRRKI